MNPTARKQRRLLGLSLYGLAALWGFNLIAFPSSSASYLLFAVALPIIVTCWCIADSRVVGRPILRSFYWLIFFLWPVAVPIYLVWARKLRGLGVAVLHGIGLYGTCLVTYNVAGCLTYGSIWFRRLF